MALSDCFVPADINLNSPNRVLLSDFGPEPAVPVGVAVPTIVPGLTEAEAEELRAELVKVWPSGSPYVECQRGQGLTLSVLRVCKVGHLRGQHLFPGSRSHGAEKKTFFFVSRVFFANTTFLNLPCETCSGEMRVLSKSLWGHSFF